MKKILYLSLFMPQLLMIIPAWAQQTTGVDTVHVYKLDGTKHCDMDSGISLDLMAQELVSNGILIYKQHKSHDGREGIAVCGRSTGSINVYEINKSNLKKALELQFQQLDASWIKPR